jgi:methionyl-tRNA formyltransferase
VKPLNIIFAGTSSFALPSLLALINSEHRISMVYTQPDRPAGRGRHLSATPVKELALTHSLPIRQPKTLRDPVEQEFLKSLQADLMIVAAYGLLLPKVILAAPSLGCINVHGSLLPRWRGAAPIQYAILSGDTASGITIMQMDEGLDTGDILHQLSCPIMENDTSQELHDRLAPLGAKALLETLTLIQSNTLNPIPQNNAQATLAPKIEKEQAAIIWNESAITISRKIRAYNPWPIAYTSLDQQILRIWQCEVLPQTTKEIPGKIINIEKNGIDVATGDGVLRLLKVQLPGGKALAVSDMLNARKNLFTEHRQLTSENSTMSNKPHA